MTEVNLIGKTVLVEDYRLTLTQIVDYVARVSNPTAEVRSSDKLIRYLYKHQHWSPFEMVHVLADLKTSRDIGRQLLRHRSMSFQEFSQRYSATETTSGSRECRTQDWQNRQNSCESEDEELKMWWWEAQKSIMDLSFNTYDQALKKGIAKEQARALLPEGLTRTRMFVSGSLRSWIHYINLRSHKDTQKEHRDLAIRCAEAIKPEFPLIEEFVWKEFN